MEAGGLRVAALGQAASERGDLPVAHLPNAPENDAFDAGALDGRAARLEASDQHVAGDVRVERRDPAAPVQDEAFQVLPDRRLADTRGVGTPAALRIDHRVVG